MGLIQGSIRCCLTNWHHPLNATSAESEELQAVGYCSKKAESEEAVLSPESEAFSTCSEAKSTEWLGAEAQGDPELRG